jgi:hypothetical protein
VHETWEILRGKRFVFASRFGVGEKRIMEAHGFQPVRLGILSVGLIPEYGLLNLIHGRPELSIQEKVNQALLLIGK